MKNKISGNLECPDENQIVGDAFNIKGWAYAGSGGEITIRILIDGVLVEKGICEFPRYDIYRKFSTEYAYLSGFMGRIVINELEAGRHTLEVIADNYRESSEIAKFNFVKKNTTFLSKLRNRREMEGFPILGGSGLSEGGARKVGEKFLDYFVNFGKLKQGHHVMDIGCGVGRMALPLTRYLTDEGNYSGTDNVKQSIDYANEHIYARYSNFRFYHTDIISDLYNPNGKFRASEYKFDFDDCIFDFIFLTSVFTHMKPDGMKNYLEESARMLKQGGRCFITYFIMNDRTREQIEKGTSERTFRYARDGYMTDYINLPEKAIAYAEQDIRKLFRDCGLMIEEPIHYGRWSGLQGLSYQDIVVAVKK